MSSPVPISVGTQQLECPTALMPHGVPRTWAQSVQHRVPASCPPLQHHLCLLNLPQRRLGLTSSAECCRAGPTTCSKSGAAASSVAPVRPHSFLPMSFPHPQRPPPFSLRIEQGSQGFGWTCTVLATTLRHGASTT